MAQALRCNICERECHAEPLSLELFSLLSINEQRLLFNIKAIYVYCKNRGKKGFINI